MDVPGTQRASFQIGERLERDLAAFQTPPPAPDDACEKASMTVSSLARGRDRLNDDSVPTSYGHRDALVRGYVHEGVILMRRGGDRTSSALLRTRGLRIRAAARPDADRTEDQRARHGHIREFCG
jgi:hypothetical protein